MKNIYPCITDQMCSLFVDVPIKPQKSEKKSTVTQVSNAAEMEAVQV